MKRCLCCRSRLLTAGIAIMLMALSGCDTAPQSLWPLETPGALQPAAPRANSTITGGKNRLPVVESPGMSLAPSPEATSGVPSAAVAPGADVTLNFVDTDIREIVRAVLGTTLKLNYTIDPGVQGTATLEVSRPLPRTALLSTLETLLNQNGATLTQRDGVYRVMPTATAATTNVVAGAAAIGAGTQVVPLRYVAAKELAKVLEPYVAEGGKVIADAGRNALVVSGDPAVRRTLIELVRAFDIDVLAGQSYAIFPASENSSAEKMAGELEKVFRADPEGPLAGVVRVVPLQRVNAILVASSQRRYIDEARRVLGLERRIEDATTRSWHVYYVQNGQSSDLENLLQRAFTPGRVSGSGGPPGATAPGADPFRTASQRPGTGGTGVTSPLAQGGTTGSRTGGLTTGGDAGLPPPDREVADPQEPLSPSGDGGADTGNRMRIIANRRNNALLIYATPNEYSIIEGMLRKIDIIPLQVMIEATIAEVTLNDNLNYGTQFFLGHTVSGVLSFAPPGAPNPVTTIAGNPVAFANDFPGFVVANGVREVINALSAVTQVKVLSAPQIMVLDNEPARLQVGALVPVLTQSQQSTTAANAPIVNSVDYRDTGVIMLVTPRVNSGGLVSLTISQEVSDVADLTTGNINSPTFNQRLIRTRVAVQDGQTLGMAGLIRDSDSQGNTGIPILKDIPLLGTLVSQQSNARQRTELLVLITPRVVRDQRDARAMTEDLRNQLINAGLVRQELQQKQPRGSPNPNRY